VRLRGIATERGKSCEEVCSGRGEEACASQERQQQLTIVYTKANVQMRTSGQYLVMGSEALAGRSVLETAALARQRVSEASQGHVCDFTFEQSHVELINFHFFCGESNRARGPSSAKPLQNSLQLQLLAKSCLCLKMPMRLKELPLANSCTYLLLSSFTSHLGTPARHGPVAIF
jgi:hypothetical protein